MRDFFVIFSRIFLHVSRIIFYLYYKSTFKSYNISSIIQSPLQLDGMSNISIGKNVVIQYKTWLAALPLTGCGDCHLEIKDGSIIGHFNHIYATKKVIIEENVLTADKVYISDNMHGYQDINLPIRNQIIMQNNEVIIGTGSWLGENVCILGAKIGRHCVIGANSVVTKDIPDYCVAVGVPAKVIKRYSFDAEKWIKVN